jgi:WD repeat-containing protein 55
MTEGFIPEEIVCETQIFDICFHPLASYLAVGQVSGAIDVFLIGEEANAHVLSINKHKKSCRGLLFSEDGQTLYSISSDKSILAVDASGQKKWHQKKAHSDAVNKIVSLREPNVFATGDDSGVVKVWDARASLAEVMTWSLHEVSYPSASLAV